MLPPPRARRRFANASVFGSVIGVSPGAAYGGAKRWLPERFAEAAVHVARERNAAIAVFGSKEEQAICETVSRIVELSGRTCLNFAGATTLSEFVELAAACELYLTNDSGPMHIASALGVPTVAVFGATDDESDWAHRRAQPSGAPASRMQSLFAARVPHRSPLHDARNCRIGCRSRTQLGRNPKTIVDTRSKIVPPECFGQLMETGDWIVIAGLFDPLTAVQANRLAAFRKDGGKLAAIVLKDPNALFDDDARATLIASLRDVHAVTIAEPENWRSLIAARR